MLETLEYEGTGSVCLGCEGSRLIKKCLNRSVSDRRESADYLNRQDDELLLGPVHASAEDLELSDPVNLPDLPSRDQSIEITTNRNRANFPGIDCIDNEKDRGKLLHFLANHELLAADVGMASVPEVSQSTIRIQKGFVRSHEGRTNPYKALSEKNERLWCFLG